MSKIEKAGRLRSLAAELEVTRCCWCLIKSDHPPDNHIDHPVTLVPKISQMGPSKTRSKPRQMMQSLTNLGVGPVADEGGTVLPPELFQVLMELLASAGLKKTLLELMLCSHSMFDLGIPFMLRDISVDARNGKPLVNFVRNRDGYRHVRTIRLNISIEGKNEEEEEEEGDLEEGDLEHLLSTFVTNCAPFVQCLELQSWMFLGWYRVLSWMCCPLSKNEPVGQTFSFDRL